VFYTEPFSLATWTWRGYRTRFINLSNDTT